MLRFIFFLLLMTKRSAESIAEMSLDLHQTPDGKWAAIFPKVADKMEVQIAATPKEAIQKAVDANYYRVSQIVLNSQWWRCFKCRRIAALQIHHVIKRSHGRKDVASNLRGLCRDCHAFEHGVN